MDDTPRPMKYKGPEEHTVRIKVLIFENNGFKEWDPLSCSPFNPRKDKMPLLSTDRH